jgi:DNA-binding PadR family transcriptional regulator
MNEDTELISDFSRFYILTILYEGSDHGYGILRKFNDRVGKKISSGFVYPFLQQLEEKKLILAQSEMQGDRERKLYTLTDEGVVFCNRLFKRFAKLVTVAIQPGLDVCAHCGCKMYEGGYRETIGGKDLVFCCVHCAASYKEEHGLQPDEKLVHTHARASSS